MSSDESLYAHDMAIKEIPKVFHGRHTPFHLSIKDNVYRSLCVGRDYEFTTTIHLLLHGNVSIEIGNCKISDDTFLNIGIDANVIAAIWREAYFKHCD